MTSNRPACGAASQMRCPNHDIKGAPWCVDCAPAGIRARAEAGEPIVIIGFNEHLLPSLTHDSPDRDGVEPAGLPCARQKGHGASAKVRNPVISTVGGR